MRIPRLSLLLLIALAVGWAAITPLLLRIADHYDGYKAIAAATERRVKHA